MASSVAWTAHAVRHVALRVLRSPLTAWQTLRTKTSGDGAVLPLAYGDDSQGKRGKSKTLVPDLLLFVCLVGFVWMAAATLLGTTHTKGQHAVQVLSAERNAAIAAITEVEVDVGDTPEALVELIEAAAAASPAHEPIAEPLEAAIAHGTEHTREPEAVIATNKEEHVATIATPAKDSLAPVVASLRTQLARLRAQKSRRGHPTPKLSQRVREANETLDIPTAAILQAFVPPGSALPVSVNEQRRLAVIDAYRHAWNGYEKYAWGRDEVRPVTLAPHDSWGGFGATLVDGLDTAMLMFGVDSPEVARARAHVEAIDWDRDFVASFFEITIRFLGGLLGAYELSKDRIYLDKAQQLGDRLVVGFDSTPTGLPKSKINLKTHKSENQRWASDKSILSEVASVQLELEYLSFHTGNPIYRDKSRKVFDVLAKAPKSTPGLYPTYIDPNTGQFTNSHISFGSFGDSFYEYMLKLYMLTDRRDQGALVMFNEAMSGMESKMVKTRRVEFVDRTTEDKRTVTKDFAFIGELRGESYTWKQEHLTCFVPGLLALAVGLVADEPLATELAFPDMKQAATNAIMQHHHKSTMRAHPSKETTSAVSPAREWTPAELELKRMSNAHGVAGAALLNTCVAAYTETTTGLAPETIDFAFAGDARHPMGKAALPQSVDPVLKLGDRPLLGELFRVDQPKYILRPETLESIFVHWRVTRDPEYREQGWAIFQNLLKACKTPGGFSALRDVNIKGANTKPTAAETQQARTEGSEPENWLNSQESFFFAETMKYMFLLFSDEDVLPLDQYVFNTEAHPLGILVEHTSSPAAASLAQQQHAEPRLSAHEDINRDEA